MKTIPSRTGILVLVTAAVVLAATLLLVRGRAPDARSFEPHMLKPGQKQDNNGGKTGNPDQDDAVKMIERGTLPKNLEKLTDKKIIRALAKRLASGKGFKPGEAQGRAVRHFCGHAEAGDGALLYSLVKSEPKGDAYFAIWCFTGLIDKDILKAIDKDLPEANNDLKTRLLKLVAKCSLPEAREVAESHALGALDPEEADLSNAALDALGRHRVWEATSRILDFYVEVDDDKLGAKAMRILGTLCEVKLRRDTDRLKVLLFAHSIVTGAIPSAEACATLLRVMNFTELRKFLKDHATAKMPARMLLVVVAGERGFDTQKGRLVHSAFLDSPDPQVVSYILVNSRYRLNTSKQGRVGPLLRDKRLSGLEGLPRDVSVAECAAFRLARAVGGSREGFPESQEDRKAQLAKWRKWWEEQK